MSIDSNPTAARAPLSRVFSRFVLVGALGFSIDATVLWLLTSHAGWSAWQARIPSFLSAVTVTWLINRRYTFRSRSWDRHSTEAFWYVTIQVGGALINLAIFGIAMWLSTALQSHPVVALALGAAGGLAFNFSLSNFVLYKPQRSEPAQ